MRNQLLVLLGFLLFFGIAFSIFLFEDVLPGSTDALCHIAFFEDNVKLLSEFLKGERSNYAYYPHKGVGMFSESYWVQTILFMAPRTLGASVVVCSWFLVLTLYSLNAWSVYQLSLHYTKNQLASIFSGLAFSASCFMLSNIELLNTLGFFFIPWSVLLLEKFIENGKDRYFGYSIILLAASHFASGYNFLFGVALWSGLFVLGYRAVSIRNLFTYSFLSLFILTPFFFRLIRIWSSDVYNPLADIPNVLDRFAMTLTGLFNSAPNNLVYTHQVDNYADLALRIPYTANFGFTLLILVIVSLFIPWRRRLYFSIASLVAIILSFGIQVEIGGYCLKLPLHYFQDSAIITFFRIPGRIFLIAQFCFAILAGNVLARLTTRLSKPLSKVIPLLLILAFTIENVPVPFPVPDSGRPRLNTPDIYGSIPKSNATLAILPSSLFTDRGYYDGMSEFSREYHYQFWQIEHGHDILNGSSSYFPMTRIRNNHLMMNLDEEINLDHLINENGVEFIVYHGKLAFDSKESQLLETLLQSQRLEIINQIGNDYLFSTTTDDQGN